MSYIDNQHGIITGTMPVKNWERANLWRRRMAKIERMTEQAWQARQAKVQTDPARWDGLLYWAAWGIAGIMALIGWGAL